MHPKDVKALLNRNPFRPFKVRLTNGAIYECNEARDFGAPRNGRLIFHFSAEDAVRIDADAIAEVFE